MGRYGIWSQLFGTFVNNVNPLFPSHQYSWICTDHLHFFCNSHRLCQSTSSPLKCTMHYPGFSQTWLWNQIWLQTSDLLIDHFVTLDKDFPPWGSAPTLISIALQVPGRIRYNAGKIARLWLNLRWSSLWCCCTNHHYGQKWQTVGDGERRGFQ